MQFQFKFMKLLINWIEFFNSIYDFKIIAVKKRFIFIVSLRIQVRWKKNFFCLIQIVIIAILLSESISLENNRQFSLFSCTSRAASQVAHLPQWSESVLVTALPEGYQPQICRHPRACCVSVYFVPSAGASATVRGSCGDQKF